MTRLNARPWFLSGVWLLTALTIAPAGDTLTDRWVYVGKNLGDDKNLAEILSIVDTAAAHGLNGMVLASGFDLLDRQRPQFFANLEKLKAHCAARGIEIIPQCFSAGYGGAVLAHDPNLAEGLPVRDALFVVRGREASLVADPPAAFINGGLEQWKRENVADGFSLQDQPGKISFCDRTVVKEGKTSLRFQSFENDPVHGHARLMQTVKVRPYRAYRASLWVKTENLQGGEFRIQVLTAKRSLAPYDLRVPATTDWRLAQVFFNSLDNSEVRIYAGVWGARSGKFWVDDLQIEEVGLVNVLRRPGTPVVVKSESGTVYEEGRDFEPVSDPKLRPSNPFHDAPPIRLTADSRIREGERLRVSWYHPGVINQSQVTICMSEPKVYEIWQQQVGLMEKYLAPKKYMLSMDEIRAGGTCEACRAQKKTMAEILGQCIARQYNMIKAANPKAEIYIWSDMLDPNHNARGDYYLVEGDYSGSWNYVPKDLVVACWYYKMAEPSLKHFSSLGFRTIGAAYYDADDLENCKGWLRALRATPGARGIMYTSWRNKYALLAAFGDLLKENAASVK